ncbi:PREDICTED: pleckstrin homology domain-containing family M member 2-like [Priapulus caudatus]|uniref:Pleckstrin homology domain-containing family M member 2-like n=1 Tax=Priapulus caudatus TaxID=37621 RepID=A0ABM1DPA1_PRICU|nr:PREDICTED: pleckstrin homology domain-containing family M member 2-like [Priapulus caudatus]
MSVSLTSFAGPDADVQRMLMEGSSDEVALYDRRVDEPASCDSDGVEAPPACDPGHREECAEDTSDVESADDTVCDSDDEESSSSSDDGAVTVPRSLSMVAPSAKRLRVGALHESDLWLDNNTLLSLMVDIIEFENEQFYKLFRASSNHTEGEILVIYLMLTNRCLYFLRQSSEPGKFYKDAVMQYKELDYVSLSMNYQTLTLVCRNERRQFCVCTADENLTRAVVSSLEIAIRRSPHVKHLPNVLTDATAQKGALRKWVAKECGCESSKVALKHYALIHWENLDAFLGTHSKTTDCEGQRMFLDTADYLSGPIWKTGYFVLKVVHLEVDQGGPLNMLILNNLLQHPMSGKPVLPPGYVKDEQLQTVVPCAAVLTRDRLMMCHEELQTGFVRSLGGAILHDLASISVDPPCKDYCVLVFEYSDDEDAEDALTYMETMEAAEMHSLGGHTHNTHWVLYFTSEWEQYKFVQSLGNTWTEIFQVDMPMNIISAQKIYTTLDHHWKIM